MALRQTSAIEVRKIKNKGRGVFAIRPIAKAEIIEQVPVIVLDAKDIENGDSWTGLAGFCFDWGRGTVALALGYGSLYNHSYKPNALYEDTGQKTKIYRAVRDIAAGEEITINYNGEPKNDAPMIFDVIEGEAASRPAKTKRANRGK